MNTLKLLIFLLSFIFYTSVHAQDWQYNFEDAIALAKEKNQNIVLLFTGSDWCPPCIKLEKRIFSDPEFKEFADQKFIWVKADFPKRSKNKLSEEQENRNMKLAERYNKKMVFPVLLVLNKQGTVLGATGYRKSTVEGYISMLTNFDSFAN
ncbi:hypothetical protein GCM10022393_17880 [Aquimarina addita]|uniref:Thioredoxin domain-containing protein n=1 Tax=Aquimarina addita TaxID=870485 RepID=A0ABP6UGZ2_9FLAO